MARLRVKSGGGWPAILYSLRLARRAGGILKLFKRSRSRNACKTCALGMGGQRGGMRDESGHFPSVCKKSFQAMAGDMDGVIDEAYFRDTSIEAMGRLNSAQFEALGRLAFPVIAEAGDSHFSRISWDEANDKIGAALKAADPAEVFFYMSGRSSNEAAFLTQIVARAFGTTNIHNCSYYCHSASGVALGQVYGSGTASVTLEDLDQADLAMVVGANPASNHPRLITRLMELRRRGGKVIVLNPLKELGLVQFRIPSDWRSLLFGSRISDLYLQPHIGSDVSLLKAMLKGVLEKNGLDRQFIESRTAGWTDVKSDVAAAGWDDLVRHCGVASEEIDQAVEMITGARNGIFLWAMGLTHHEHGVDNILALSNLALARGWLGRKGAGLLPIRGHSNVQGVGSVGVTPGLKEAFSQKLADLYGIDSSQPGQDTYASMVAAREGRIQAALLLGGNLFSSNPDRTWAAEAMRRIPFSAGITTKLNEGHVHGRGQCAILLPCLARDEEDQWTTQESMFNFVRLSEGGPPAVKGELRSEVDIVASIAERILPDSTFDWSALRSHKRLREEIARTVPGYGPMKDMDKTKREFQIQGRTMHGDPFPTADGLAHFRATPVPDVSVADDEFRLMTIRSEGQFNTVVYEEEDLYRGNERRDVVMISAEDASRLSLSEDDPIHVESETGSLLVRVSVTDIRSGNLAMYFPEANVLVPRRIDRQSKTPAFKFVRVRLRKA